MKKYRIKKIDASALSGLRGLHIIPLCQHYSEVLVLDKNVFNHFGECRQIPLLPKSSNTELVCAVLSEMQRGNATSETVKKLKDYLQYTEKKDKNSEIKSDVKQAIKQFFFGLALVMGAVAGCMLMLLLIGLYPLYVSWISLLSVPIVAVAAYGIINSLVGVVKFGFGIFSFCFRHNNSGQLLELENALHRFCFSPPPSYQEVMGNCNTQTSLIYIPVQQTYSSGYTPSFYHRSPDDAKQNWENEDSPPAYRYCVREG